MKEHDKLQRRKCEVGAAARRPNWKHASGTAASASFQIGGIPDRPEMDPSVSDMVLHPPY